MPVTTLRPRRLRHSNELALKNNGAARYPVPQVGFLASCARRKPGVGFAQPARCKSAVG
jgi:hypothetical protein